MRKIAIIIPYFGKLPHNMNTFLITCKFNEKIDWYIFTDHSTSNFLKVENVHFIRSTFKEVKQRIKSVVGNRKIVLNKPYKLCDYRPLYGLAFQDILHNYDYWGYSDLDVVYGDLWKFIKKGIKEKVDKIGEYGHFMLFRNDSEINQRYKLPIMVANKKVCLFNIASTTSAAYHFDEADGINKIYNYYGYSVYNNRDLLNEPYPENMDLISMDDRFFKLPDAYVWKKNICLFVYKRNGRINYKEFGYFHFQKRRFKYFLNDNGIDMFYIDTYGYHRLDSFSDHIAESLIKENTHSFAERFKYLLYSLFKTPYYSSKSFCGIRIPIMHVLIRIYSEKNFFV